MPIKKTITLYSFDELSEQAQDKAIESLSGVNVDHDWWDCILKDAANIGLRIYVYYVLFIANIDNKEFNPYRNTIKGNLTEYLLDVCKSIRMNHGKDCDTFKTGAKYHKAYIAAFMEWYRTQTQQSDPSTSRWKPVDWLAEFKYQDEAQEIEADLTKALLKDYTIILKKEHDSLTSRQEIVSTIKANEYLFKEDGTLCTFWHGNL